MSAPRDETSFEGPYPLAARMREQGRSDEDILTALRREGVSEEDAAFILGSLPGGALDIPEGHGELTRSSSESALGNPIPGWIWMFAGALGTFVNHELAGPAGLYVVAGGVAFAGLLLAFRGR